MKFPRLVLAFYASTVATTILLIGEGVIRLAESYVVRRNGAGMSPAEMREAERWMDELSAKREQRWAASD